MSFLKEISLKRIYHLIISSILYGFYSLKYSRVDYFSYKKLANPNFVEPAHFNSVFHYGNYKAIEKITNKKFNFIYDCIEHGLCFSDVPESVLAECYVDRSGIKNIYTFSEYRKKVINLFLAKKKLNINIYTVGPYIQGAPYFYKEHTLQHLKEKFGKILLFFPPHSIETLHVDYNLMHITEEIEKIKGDFDNIFVCMYWLDILNRPDIIKYYEEKKYIIVSAGHRSDPRFLSRLKDLIYLSNMVLLNSIGTNLGYVIALNRPVYFIYQESSEEINPTDELPLWQKGLSKKNEKLNQRCLKLFGDYSYKITKEQVDFIKEYWGGWITK